MKSILLSIFTLVVFSYAGVSAIQAQDALENSEKGGGKDKYQMHQAEIAASSSFVSTGVVINEVYGGAGCGTANCSTYQNDFIELKNIGTGLASIGGWSVQYASATGTAWQVTPIPAGTTLRPGDTYLIAQSFSANGTSPIPTPNTSGTIAMSATAAKIALVNTTTALSGACPTGNATIVDFVSYGATANCAEDPSGTASGTSTLLGVAGNGAPAPSTTTSISRNAAGVDTDDNSADFAIGAPTPQAALQPTAALATVEGKVVNSVGSGLSKITVTITDSAGNSQQYLTSSFGYFTFEGLRTGETYVVSVRSKMYRFEPATRVIMLEQDLRDLEFTASPQE
jgi:hypothetical protein